ncbi:CU044_5270 family protein [Actinomadura yumaensis]|uniref:CU044_5270 family protein n=2 Tax=Actinomadura TaxID=1988 RepID=A0ABW2CRY3_9ACTN
MTQGRDADMNVEDRLSEAMHRTAEELEPPVAELVSGGTARGRRRRLRNRTAAASAATAVAVAAGALAVGGPGGSGGGPVAPTPTAVRLVNASEVLGQAARAAEARPAPKPRPNQWWYTRSLEAGIAAEHGPKPRLSENWTKLDGSADAGLKDGRLVFYPHTKPGAKSAEGRYERLASLPADPVKLRSIVYAEAEVEAPGDQGRDGGAFRAAAQMLWDAPPTMPPATQAALYRVLAAIPGVQVERGVKDGAGRPAMAVSRKFGDQYLLDPRTYEMVAQRTVSNGHNAPISRDRSVPHRETPAGTVTYSLTRVATKIVDRAGQR